MAKEEKKTLEKNKRCIKTDLIEYFTVGLKIKGKKCKLNFCF